MTDAFAALLEEPRWLVWREEERGGKKTKVPFAARRQGLGSATDPATWGTHAEAEGRARGLQNGSTAGCGIVLGDLGDHLFLAGLDLDSSIDPSGALAGWAGQILDAVASYSEISPSGRGLKTFFYLAAEDVRWFLDRIGVEADKWGAKRGIPGLSGADHGPGIELYCSHRYFTVTGQLWSADHPRIALLARDRLEALVALIPPAARPHVDTAGSAGGHDTSRSARALRAARAMGAGSFEEMCDGLRNHSDPQIRAWVREKGEASGSRELHRIWARLAADDDRHEPVQIHDASDIAMTEIPPRGWLLGTTFCRKFIAGLIAEGGVGKTAIRYAQYLACAVGRNEVTGEHVHHRCRSLIVCLEDDLNEVRRRIGAAMLHHGVTPAEVRGFLFYCAPRGLKLLQADPRGLRTIGALYQELRVTIEKLKIDIVGIDPFVKAHGVEENDNNAIDQICIMLADIGDEFDCAIDIVSHARKGTAIPGDADRDRGASAKKDAGRLIRTVTGMTTDEAELFGVAPADRPRLIRVDDAKVNLAARTNETMWFKIVGVPLGNGTLLYPKGDTVQTVERWAPPDAFAKLTPPVIENILNRIEAGPYEGGRYSPASNAAERAAWPLVRQLCPDLKEAQAKHVISTWVKNAVLVKRNHKDPKDRHDHPSLFVGARPGTTWEA